MQMHAAPIALLQGRSRALFQWPARVGVTGVTEAAAARAGVGKSTTAVNLAYTLAQMGARVGIFDADVYGPSLPTMVSPEERVMHMDPRTRALTPTEYGGVKLVSFGYAGQGSAIMRGPMVSGTPLCSCTHRDPARWSHGLVHTPGSAGAGGALAAPSQALQPGQAQQS